MENTNKEKETPFWMMGCVFGSTRSKHGWGSSELANGVEEVHSSLYRTLKLSILSIVLFLSNFH